MIHDEDLLRLAGEYVIRQCGYMNAAPTVKQIETATRKVYDALHELRMAQLREKRPRAAKSGSRNV